jgi:hypothetical protein
VSLIFVECIMQKVLGRDSVKIKIPTELNRQVKAKESVLQCAITPGQYGTYPVSMRYLPSTVYL